MMLENSRCMLLKRINCLDSLITLKNKRSINGGLIYQGNDVIDICFIPENNLRKYNYTNKIANKLQIQTNILKSFVLNSNIFQSFKII